MIDLADEFEHWMREEDEKKKTYIGEPIMSKYKLPIFREKSKFIFKEYLKKEEQLKLF